jgi:hypothetical protein
LKNYWEMQLAASKRCKTPCALWKTTKRIDCVSRGMIRKGGYGEDGIGAVEEDGGRDKRGKRGKRGARERGLMDRERLDVDGWGKDGSGAPTNQ